MCEGPSSICGPIPPDPSLFPQYYKRPASALGRLEGNKRGTATLLSGPFAPDPVLHPECYSARGTARRPRISAKASHILERGQRGVIRELLEADCYPATEIIKPKERELNFRKENILRLREIQRRCKESEAERARSAPLKALWTSSKYDNIRSKFMEDLQITSPAVKPQCRNFLKAHSKNKVPPRPHSTSTAVTLRQSCTPIQDKNLQVKGQTIDFIRYNALAAGKTMQRSQSLTNLQDKPVPSAAIGQVPQYIKERKKQWRKEEEEEKRKKLNPSVPDGHTLMTDSDRQETLKRLKENHRSLVTELLLLPLKADNLSVRARRAYLDRRLSEIEEAIKIFSRAKVYVKLNS
ncbi:enkurin domain-containing protein 1 isoform X2 [Corythoichthys intestinalis]|uniref:enkurin domain-containing protein 1 isoform X2 n=1 Tax=Corythoichthys intestinalis TaxID=161448 RepID=UPI0025A5C7B2|nr:enkurin domain-containing protein 1 isoform X2 [Corythoichthys intestinalis]XP_061804313.1 enkurin domain-containing protein 1-like [Nerophis lumbriciformis]